MPANRSDAQRRASVGEADIHDGHLDGRALLCVTRGLRLWAT
ncbi:hypothetical protein I553_0147 [Mycobacterium xenopi 4042]|uniref:Uncharacterized protein n=1 Tax=Mycobacterium xenopi 4042 TaxID=1299334 RepID=X7YIX3_MYCXE|nr:hypothetical protein I553_0147 [Mycobacterium xenopi 4042]